MVLVMVSWLMSSGSTGISTKQSLYYLLLSLYYLYTIITLISTGISTLLVMGIRLFLDEWISFDLKCAFLLSCYPCTDVSNGI